MKTASNANLGEGLPAFRRDALDLFWWFVCERQMIWRRRFEYGLSPPWTRDQILSDHRFTNVYRELDPGTVYATRQILARDAPVSARIFNVMIYRLVGRPETHQHLGFQWPERYEPQEFTRRLKWIRDVQHGHPFTGAYVVAGYQQMGSRDKIENVARLFALIASRFEEFNQSLYQSRSMCEAYSVLRSAPGFGNFLSYQVLVDLTYTLRTSGRPVLNLCQDEWASAGPGARGGISILVGKEGLRHALDVMRWLRISQESEFTRLKLTFPYLRGNEGQPLLLSLPNVQNCLCEFYKYYKIAQGLGRARRAFRVGEGSLWAEPGKLVARYPA